MNNNQLLSNYYSEHRDEMIHFIAVRIMDVDEAQDMVQDIFLRLLRGHHLITPETLSALTYTMARNSVSDHYRRRRIYEEYEHYIQTSDVRHQTSNDPASIYSATQIMERMERSLARLPKACCEIYRLHIYDGLKVSDIARELSLPYKQVENRLGQARKAVRQQLRCCV
jgi:RNA polymerase sigma-70 factor (ECF subfamily)